MVCVCVCVCGGGGGIMFERILKRQVLCKSVTSTMFQLASLVWK